MPPWGAVKGFGDFRNDQALTSEQIELIASWVNGGAPEGDAKDLRQPDPGIAATAENPQGGIAITADTRLRAPLALDGILPRDVAEGASFRVTAELPDGSIEPLLWVYQYKRAFRHPFLLREPMRLPLGSTIRGIPTGSALLFLEASSSGSLARRSGRY